MTQECRSLVGLAPFGGKKIGSYREFWTRLDRIGDDGGFIDAKDVRNPCGCKSVDGRCCGAMQLPVCTARGNARNLSEIEISSTMRLRGNNPQRQSRCVVELLDI